MGRRTRASDIDQCQSPVWLLAPPDGDLPPPVSTRKALLPLTKLGWRDFERLCLRLASLEDAAEHWQLYGTAGQEQGGIDIFVRRVAAEKYTVWQSKRYSRFRASHIEAAVTVFLNGNWADRTDHFVLSTTASLDGTQFAEAIEEQAARLRRHNIKLEVLGAERLSERLKTEPAIVDDFFDRAWTRQFCGEHAAAALGERLGRKRMGDMRSALATLYEGVFASADPGVLRAASGLIAPPKALPLARRFVPPDLSVPSEIEGTQAGRTVQAATPAEAHPFEVEDESTRRWSRRGPQERRVSSSADRAGLKRVSLPLWSGSINRSVVLGGPGSGKSTLLRFLALDMLSPEPHLAPLRRRWPAYLPVLLPFAFWTRLIAGGATGEAASVQGAVRAWFTQLGSPDLAAHVDAAFEDGRVMLLVDGVDEWTNEEAAGTALTQLHVFATTSRIPCILTSRPHGARVLAALDASWVRYSLAPFDGRQQRQFAEAWFEWLDEAEGRAGGSALAAARAEAFVEELSRAPQIMPLSGTPLLLSGLIAIARDGGTVPGSRLEAYRELLTRVLDTHPRSRSRASLQASGQQEMDSPNRRRALAALAFSMQGGSREGVGIDGLDVGRATVRIRDFLSEALDLPADRARERATQLVAVGTEAIGVLVERAPGEIAFLHRAFQELLAAEHLAGLDLDEQTAIFAARASDAQWRDVLLFTVQLARRSSDVERLVDTLEAASVAPGAAGPRDLLLAEIAFGTVERSAALTRRLATRFLDEIELGGGDASRDALLPLAVSGLLSEQTLNHVAPRLRRWFPNVQPYKMTDTLNIIADWPGDDVDRVLLCAFEHPAEDGRRQAALSLARRKEGDAAFGTRLLALARRPHSIDAAQGALRCLLAGWADLAEVTDLAEAAADAEYWQINHVGIEARIARVQHRESDRDRLLNEFWAMEDESSGSAARLLVLGWPNDAMLKQFVLTHLADNPPHNFELWRFASAAFPGDQDVAARLAADFTAKAGRYHLHENFRHLARSFAGNAILADALAQGHDEDDRAYVLAHAARIAPTARIRAGLMDVLRDRDRLAFWAVGALVELWPEDAEVRAALDEVLNWPPHLLIRSAEFIPAITRDDARARTLLVELVRWGLADGHRNLVGAMNALAPRGGVNAELAEAIVTAAEGAAPDDSDADLLMIAAAQAAPSDPRVHALAQVCLRRSSGLLAPIALLLGKQEAMRAAVLESCAPLPQPLRTDLLVALSTVAPQSPEAVAALAEGREDSDRAIASDATVLHAAALAIRGEVGDGLLARLEADLQAVGAWLEPRRLAALAALLAIGRPDLVERGAAARNDLRVGLGSYAFESDGPTLKALAAAWPQVQTLLDDGKSWLSIDDLDLVGRLTRYEDIQPLLATKVTAAAGRLLERAGQPPIGALRRLFQEQGARPAIVEALVALLNNRQEWGHLEISISAGTILAQEFRGNAEIMGQIEARFAQGAINGAVAALCDGWPNSAVLRTWYETIRGNPEAQRTLAFPTSMKILGALSPPDILVQNLETIAAQMAGAVWEGAAYWTGTLSRRFASDDEAYALLAGLMRSTASPGARISAASLLVQARGLTSELKDWIIAQIDHEPGRGLAEIGVDVSLGHSVIVRQRLTQLLVTVGAGK